jgi:hypothetical protein
MNSSIESRPECLECNKPTLRVEPDDGRNVSCHSADISLGTVRAEMGLHSEVAV